MLISSAYAPILVLAFLDDIPFHSCNWLGVGFLRFALVLLPFAESCAGLRLSACHGLVWQRDTS